MGRCEDFSVAAQSGIPTARKSCWHQPTRRRIAALTLQCRRGPIRAKLQGPAGHLGLRRSQGGVLCRGRKNLLSIVDKGEIAGSQRIVRSSMYILDTFTRNAQLTHPSFSVQRLTISDGRIPPEVRSSKSQYLLPA